MGPDFGYNIRFLFQSLSGAEMMGAWIAGLFFLRFWKKVHDRLFLFFGIAFWLMALEQFVIAFLINPEGEDHSYLYLFRLFAFILILYAIIDKNRKRERRPK